MPYSLRDYAVTKNKTAFILCTFACFLMSWGYLRLIEQLLYLPFVLQTKVPPVPVLMQVAPAVQKPSVHKGGLAALTPINYTPRSPIVPKTGQRLTARSKTAHFVTHTKTVPLVHLKHKLYIEKAIDSKIKHSTRAKGRAKFIDVKAGGNTLVLALLVDSEGVIVRIKVLVPSRYPFMDMNYTLWLLGHKAGTPDPPIPAGHTRWIDLKIRYHSRHPKVALP